MRAIVSVSDKSGVVDFARGLKELGIEIFSTGGTKKSLEAARERYRLKMLRDDNRLTVNESIYMEHLLKVSLNPTTGKRQLANLRMNNFKGVKKTDLDLSAISNDIRLKNERGWL